jgi:L-ascorbate metabolism protein UlaG (beta-lactamase superfamily)
VTDPFDPKTVGIKYPKVESDIITVSHDHDDHNQIGLVENNPLVINMPGEFEKKGMRIFGFQSYHDDKKGEEKGENIIFKIETEGITILHCGDIGYVPDDNFIDVLGVIDVLLVPVGGNYTVDAGQAAELVKKIEPKIIIPMHFGMNSESPEKSKLAPVSEFLKKMSSENISAVPKLVLKKEDLTEEMKVVLMENS